MKSGETAFTVDFFPDQIYGQLIMSIGWRVPIDTVFTDAKLERSSVAKALSVKDGVEGVRMHRYTLDVICARTFSEAEMRESILSFLYEIRLINSPT